jgi:hypothetical protein
LAGGGGDGDRDLAKLAPSGRVALIYQSDSRLRTAPCCEEWGYDGERFFLVQVVHASGSNVETPVWCAPQRYLDAAIAVIGQIDLDSASSEIAQRHVQASKYFTVENGLTKQWHGRVFLNPPYARPKLFVAKMAKMIESFRL